MPEPLPEMVVRLTGSPSKIVQAPLPQDDPRQRKPDIALARKALGWTPAVGLEQGLQKTIAYFDGLIGKGAYPERPRRPREGGDP